MKSLQYKNSISILKNAIDNGINLNQSSVELGFYPNYFQKVKARLSTFLENGSITDKEYNEFEDLYFKYSNKKLNKPNTVITNNVKDDAYDSIIKIEQIRDEISGNIIRYSYYIPVRDEDPIVGSLTREQVESIYFNYPYVTQNTCSKFFPYLTFTTFKKIIRAFNITKDKLFPPHILEEKEVDEIAELGLKAKEHAATKKLIEKKETYFEQQFRDTQKKLLNITDNNSYIDEVIKKYYTEESTDNKLKNTNLLNNRNNNLSEDGETLYCLFSDIHYGKKFNEPVFGRNYNKDIAHDRVMQIAKKCVKVINECNYGKLKLLFLGDLLETAMESGMHPGQTLHNDLQGYEQILYAIESFETAIDYIIDNVNNKSLELEIHLIGGNHDRMELSRDADKSRTGSRIVFKILERNYSKKGVKVNVPENNIVNIYDKNLCIIGFHGDNSLLKRKPSELINLHGIGRTGYHLIISGHYHRTKIECGTNYMTISLPSVCSVDEYILNELGLNNLPGYMLGKMNNQTNMFDFFHCSLY